MIERMQAIDPELPVTFVYGAQSWVDRATGWNFKNSHNGYVDIQVQLVSLSLCMCLCFVTFNY